MLLSIIKKQNSNYSFNNVLDEGIRLFNNIENVTIDNLIKFPLEKKNPYAICFRDSNNSQSIVSTTPDKDQYYNKKCKSLVGLYEYYLEHNEHINEHIIYNTFIYKKNKLKRIIPLQFPLGFKNLKESLQKHWLTVIDEGTQTRIQLTQYYKKLKSSSFNKQIKEKFNKDLEDLEFCIRSVDIFSNKCLFGYYRTSQVTRDSLHKKLKEINLKIANLKEDLQGKTRVFIRIRQDLSEKQKFKGELKLKLKANQISALTISNSKFCLKYTGFNNIFFKENNNEIYQRLKSTLNQVLDGYKVLLFVYGYSGTGKTYTLFGNQQTNGVIQEFFKKNPKKFNQNVELQAIVQDYKDTKMGQLSNLDKVFKQKIIKNKTFATLEDYKSKLNEFYIKEEIVLPTSNNAYSSRGHTALIFTTIEKKGQLIVIDMAGSENGTDMLTKMIDFSSEGNKNISLNNKVSITTLKFKNLTHLYKEKFLKYYNTLNSSVKVSTLTGQTLLQSKKIVRQVFNQSFFINQTLNIMKAYFQDDTETLTDILVPQNNIKDPNLLSISDYESKEIYFKDEEEYYLMYNWLQDLSANNGDKITKSVVIGTIKTDKDSNIDALNADNVFQFCKNIGSEHVTMTNCFTNEMNNFIKTIYLENNIKCALDFFKKYLSDKRLMRTDKNYFNNNEKIWNVDNELKELFKGTELPEHQLLGVFYKRNNTYYYTVDGENELKTETKLKHDTKSKLDNKTYIFYRTYNKNGIVENYENYKYKNMKYRYNLTDLETFIKKHADF